MARLSIITYFIKKINIKDSLENYDQNLINLRIKIQLIS